MIQFVKLITNDDIIADVIAVKENKDKVELKNPVRIVFTQQGVGMVPYSPFTKESTKIIVDSKNILYTGELEEEIYNGYNSKFGSGIILASNDFNVIT
jgi:hypothetical protein